MNRTQFSFVLFTIFGVLVLIGCVTHEPPPADITKVFPLQRPITTKQVDERSSINEKMHANYTRMKINRAKGLVQPSLFFGDVFGKTVDEQMKKMNLISVMSEDAASTSEDYFLHGKEFPETFLFMNRFKLSCISVDIKSRRVVGLFSFYRDEFSDSEMVEFSNNLKDTLDEHVFPNGMEGKHIGMRNKHRWIWNAPDGVGNKYQYVLLAMCHKGTAVNDYKDKWKIYFGINLIRGETRNRAVAGPAIEDGTSMEYFDFDNRVTSSGSAFCVSTNGYMFTNFHVVEGAITNKTLHIAALYENSLYDATYIRGSEKNDIALLKINKKTLPIPIAHTNIIRLGQNVFTVGFPVVTLQGFSPKMSRGVISGLKGIKDLENEYQIDVAIQPGNSGGPLVDGDGTLVGMVVARMHDEYFYKMTGMLPQGINYAIKAKFLQELCSDIPEIMTVRNYASSTTSEDVVEKVVKSCALVFVYE